MVLREPGEVVVKGSIFVFRLGLVKYLFYRAYFVNGAAFSMQFDIFN